MKNKIIIYTKELKDFKKNVENEIKKFLKRKTQKMQKTKNFKT